MKEYHFIQPPGRCFNIFLTGFILFFQLFFAIHSFAGIKLVWDASSSEDVSGYNIYYKEKSEENFYQPEDWTTTDTEFAIVTEDMELYFTDQVTYSFTVTAYNDCGESDYSNIVEFTYDASGSEDGTTDTEDDDPDTNSLKKSSSGGGGCFIISIE